MSIFFKNEGSTCFFNVTLQLCLQNIYFRHSIENFTIDNSIILKYLHWFHHLPNKLIKPNTNELLQGRKHGLILVFQKFFNALHIENNNSCFTANIHEIAEFLPLVYDAIQKNIQCDVLECMDEILDTLSIPGTIRPNSIQFNDDSNQNLVLLNNSILQHCDSFHHLWGIQKKIHTCTKCNQNILYELIPFTWITKTSESDIIHGAFCKICNELTTRNVFSSIVQPPKSIIVRIERHNADGSKNHRDVSLSENVNIHNSLFQLRTIILHDGWSFNSGHYTCLIKHFANDRWIYNSDIFATFVDSCKIHTNKTYAALYLLT